MMTPSDALSWLRAAQRACKRDRDAAGRAACMTARQTLCHGSSEATRAQARAFELRAVYAARMASGLRLSMFARDARVLGFCAAVLRATAGGAS